LLDLNLLKESQTFLSLENNQKGEANAPFINVFIWPARCDWNWLHGWWWRNQSVSGLFERD